jgi:MFS family permease
LTDARPGGQEPREIRAGTAVAERGADTAVASADGIVTPPPSERRLKTFDSLIDVPAFRWYLLSMASYWSALQMQQVARGYLTYQITGSYAALGLVELANTVPRIFLALYGGVLADRASRRIIIQVGQVVAFLNAAVIAALLFTDQLVFWHLIASAVVHGTLNSFSLPARQAMIPEIVGPNRLMNAFALNVFVSNIMRLGAPVLAGGIIAAMMTRSDGDVFLSVGTVFAIMAVLNVIAVILLLPVPVTNAATRASRSGVAVAERPTRGKDRLGLGDIKEAFVYLRGEHIILWLMVIHSSTAMLSFPYQRMMPGFVEDILSSSPEQTAVLMGLLLTMTAIGALVGSLIIASLPDRNRGKLLIISLAIFGGTLMAFSASTVLVVSAAIALALGVGQSMRQAVATILIQSRLEDAYRGRVSSIMLLDDGLESLGVFGIALLADVVGVQLALGSVGLFLLLYGGVLWATKPIRQLD